MSNNKDFKVKNGIQPTVYHEAVGTVVSGSVGYYLAGASYDSVSFSVASQDTAPFDLAFNTDGTKMYMLGNTDDTLYQYSLSTAFDLSTASYDSVSFSVTGQDSNANAIVFNADGTKMYMVGIVTDSIYQYSLSTAFDLSTASYDSVSLDVSGQDTNPHDIAFNNNGTKMYMIGNTYDDVYQYSLSTAFDLSTASYDSVSLDASSLDSAVQAIVFNNDGTKMYLSGGATGSIYQFSLSTAFDLSTASYDSVSFSVTSQEAIPRGVVFNSDGTNMYIIGNVSDSVHQYSTVLNTAELDLSTGSVFEVTPTSDIQVTLSNPADSGTVSGATLLLEGAATNTYDIANAVYDNVSYSGIYQSLTMSGRFNDDGTKFYSANSSTEAIWQHSLSTPYDISTASYDSVSLDISSQETNIRDMKFKPDGTELFIVGTTSDRVKQYTLSTAWDLSTASYTGQSASVGSQTPEPYSIILNDDGTKLYVGDGANNDRIYGYSLSTAYDVTTLSYDSQNVSFSSQVNALRDMVYNSDGTKLYLLDGTTDSIYQYTLSTAYNPLTLSYDSISFSVTTQSINPTFVEFKPDGTKMYSGGSSTNTVYQYSTASPATITYDTAIEWPGGTAPTSPAIGETDIITFNTRDGGITYSGVLAIDGAK